MQTLIQIALIVLGCVLVGSFIVAFIANVILGFHINRDQMKKKYGASAFWNFGNPLTPIECYHEDVWKFWPVRDRCLKIFAIACGAAVILAVIAAIAGVKLG